MLIVVIVNKDREVKQQSSDQDTFCHLRIIRGFDGNPYARMDTSTSYVYMVWRLHRRGFGATSALDGSLIFDRSISFLEKLLLTLLRIYTRLDCLESRSLKCCCEYQPPHWFILIAIFRFPSLLRIGGSDKKRRNRGKLIFSQEIDRGRKRNPNKK